VKLCYVKCEVIQHFTLCSPSILTLIFSILTNECPFYFRISVQLTLHIQYFGRDSAIISGTLISSFHCSPVHLVLSQNCYTVSIQNQLPEILIIFNNFNNFNDFNNFQRHSALYSQFIVLYFTLLTQDKYYIHQDVSIKSLKKLCIPVIVNGKIASNSVTVL
jgi:hypothetical protein